MAFSIDIPFFAAKLRLYAGNTLMMPLLDNNAVRLDEPLHLLSGKYAEQLQQKVFNKGEYLKLMDEYRKGDFNQGSIVVEFPKAEDGLKYPNFELEFTYFFNKNNKGFWGVVPTLGLESFAKSANQLKDRLKETIKLEFARKKRLDAVQKIVATIWYNEVELEGDSIQMRFPSPSELEKISEEKKEELLPKVAQKLNISRQITFGREKELKQLADALNSEFNRNVILVGPSGVGKTALIWEICRQRKKRKIKGNFWETTASTLIKELTQDTGWQDNLSYLCRELAKKNDILFVRNLMELFEVGQYVGNSVSMAAYMRSFVSRGEVTLVSECTEEELAQIELKSPNYIALFQVIRMEEPKGKVLEKIIVDKVTQLANVRKVQFEGDAIREVIRLNRRFTPYAGFPGKPIRFLESILISKKDNTNTKAKKRRIKKTESVSRAEVIKYFCEETGMPVFMVDPEVHINLRKIKADFNNNVFGQEAAVESVVDLLAAVKTALTRSGKPIASFLFVGPTGVGKTELAKVLANFMFGSRNRMIRFDMSEYSSPFTVMRLVGTSHSGDGLLTSAVKKEPFSVLLFDEIEKADSTFYDLLLQILSEGRLTDNKGKLVNFCSTIIIMTSNIGAKNLQTNRIGWASGINAADVTQHFRTAVQKHFRPELFGRIDEVIAFEPLSKETMRFVVEREMELFRKREGIRFRRMDLEMDEGVLDFVAEKGYDPKYGARELQRAIRERLIIPLAQQLNLEEYDDQLVVKIFIENDDIQIHIEADPLGLELWLEELDKINHADHSSELRRQIYQLKEGHFFVKLLSELDLMEREKRRLGDKFWEKREKAELYSYYLKTKADIEQLMDSIEKSELELALACMDLRPYNMELVEQLEAWKKNFFDMKIEIYTRMHPKSSHLHLGIYGQNLPQIIQFYIKIFRKKGYQFAATMLWFRESYFNEEVEFSEYYMDLDEEKEIEINRKKKRKEYIKEPFNFNNFDKNFSPPEKSDILCGIELAISGNAAWLYLKDEEGKHRWKMSDNTDFRYIVKTSNDVFATPDNIHRREFYMKQTIRRTIEPNSVKDSILKINRELGKYALLDFMMEYLEKNFEQKLNGELI